MLTKPRPQLVSTSREVSSVRKGDNNKTNPPRLRAPPWQASQATKFSGWRYPQWHRSHRALGTEGKCCRLRGVSGIDPGGAQLLPPPGCGPSGRRTGPQTQVPGYHLGLNYSDRHLQGTTHPHPIQSAWCRQEAFRAEMSVNKENKSQAPIHGSKMFPQFKASPAWGNKVKWSLIVSFRNWDYFIHIKMS